MKRVLVALIAGAVLSGVAAAYASSPALAGKVRSQAPAPGDASRPR